MKKAACAAALLGVFACMAADPAAVADWERTRRAETLSWFEENQFGRTPVGRLPDQALGESSVAFTNAGIRIDIACRLPKGADAAHPAPVFLFGDHVGGNTPPDYLLIAPRLVYVASGSEDAWAGPAAEKAAWDAAHDLWRAYGHEERMGYHCHDGPHKLLPFDRERFMDFADRHMKDGKF